MRLLACLIVAPQRGYDEPAILSYAISSFCPTSADGLQPAFVRSMIFRATASRSGSASSEGRSVASAISNATPIRRTVSGSKLRSSKYVLRAMREHSTRKCFLITKLRAVRISLRGCNQRTLRCIGLGTVAGNGSVANLSKKLGTIACPRCEAPMEEVVRIAPAQNGPGLIGYECPSCNYVTSVLTPSKSPRRPQGRPKQSLS